MSHRVAPPRAPLVKASLALVATLAMAFLVLAMMMVASSSSTSTASHPALSNGEGAPELFQAVPRGGLQPVDLLGAYDIAPLRALGLDGTGETVAFFESDGFAQSDLDAFTQRFGLPPMQPIIKAGPTLTTIGGETEMDLEVVHEIAPGARLLLYNSNATSIDAILALQNQMVTQNAGGILSLSWGLACDIDAGAAIANAYKTMYDQADLLGESVFAATGDATAYECLEDRARGTAPATPYLGVLLPAAAPGVTAVGGTRISEAIDKSWYNETVWEDPIETAGGGGGVSVLYPMPAWQRGPGVDSPQYNPHNMREVPDVSADADPASGAAIDVNSSWVQGGGTSQAAPIWAGLTALINEYLKRQRLKGAGFLNPALYHLAATPQHYPPFHDITVGTNLYYPATPGYDLATGLGTPDGWNLARDLAAYQKNGGR